MTSNWLFLKCVTKFVTTGLYDHHCGEEPYRTTNLLLVYYRLHIFDQVESNIFEDMCKQDWCKAETDAEKTEVICNSLNDYSLECSTHGIPVNWRSEGLCRKCSKLEELYTSTSPLLCLL